MPLRTTGVSLLPTPMESEWSLVLTFILSRACLCAVLVPCTSRRSCWQHRFRFVFPALLGVVEGNETPSDSDGLPCASGWITRTVGGSSCRVWAVMRNGMLEFYESEDTCEVRLDQTWRVDSGWAVEVVLLAADIFLTRFSVIVDNLEPEAHVESNVSLIRWAASRPVATF